MNTRSIVLLVAAASALAAAGLPGTVSGADFRMPRLRGFTRVEPGEVLKQPAQTPDSRPHALSLDADITGKTDDQAVLVNLDGLARADMITPAGQLLIFESGMARRPAIATLRLPFDLHALMDEPMEGELRYRARLGAMVKERSFTLNLAGDHRFQAFQKSGPRPAAVDPNDRNNDAGGPRLLVRQGGEATSTDRPSHDYTYPVPVEVETADGTVTWLWQGQWVELPGDREDQTLHLLVLVSEVAKPTGNAIHVFEGAPYDLQILLVTQDR